MVVLIFLLLHGGSWQYYQSVHLWIESLINGGAYIGLVFIAVFARLFSGLWKQACTLVADEALAISPDL